MKKSVRKLIMILVVLTMLLQTGTVVFAAETTSLDYTLVEQWDFTKVVNGDYSGLLADRKLNDDHVASANGIAAVSADVTTNTGGNYHYLCTLNSACSGTDRPLYTLKNKTVVMKAKIECDDTDVHGCLLTRNGATEDFFPITSQMITGEYRIYAISVTYNEDSETATKSLWMSKNEYPQSAADFTCISTADVPDDDVINLDALDPGVSGVKRNVYFGAKDGSVTDPGCSTYFDDIKVYNGILNASDLADVSRPPMFVGAQIAAGKEGAVNTQDNTFAIRFVGAVGSNSTTSISLDELGFKIEAKYTDPTLGETTKTLSDKVGRVYTSIIADTSNGIERMEARTLSNTPFLYTLSIIDIPDGLITNGNSIVFTVTPYSIADGATEEDLGFSYTVTVTYDDSKTGAERYAVAIVRNK